ncbi:MAG: hypothetical protein KDK37_18725, partial [Leptospiraceae bacterium]|nr:hypothetical protein [Leptospiraceae bacterium]
MTQPRKGSAQSEQGASPATPENTDLPAVGEWNGYDSIRNTVYSCLLLLAMTSSLFGSPDQKPKEPSPPDGQLILQRA